MDESTARSCHSDGMRQSFLWAFLPTLVLFLITPFVGNAEAVTSITSSGLGTEVPLLPPSDGVYDITGGTRPGGGPNLFHSFGDFSIGQGDIANFLNDSALTTSNIIGRVTGGNMSNIDGIIQTTGFGSANLFLVNPSGIVFGPNGSFDVGGSVSFSTAQYLRLFDGDNSANFYANPANDGLANSVFAMAPVVDFGFLSPAAYGFLTAPDPSATITVLGSALSVLPGQSISLVGGDITIQAASLRAQSGQLNLVSVASPGEVLLPDFQTGPNINGASFTTMGTVTITESALLNVSGLLVGQRKSGTVLVRGGQLVMDASFILANTVGAVDGARTAVDIQVSHDVALSNGALISVGTSSSGRGGDVVIAAESVYLDTSSNIITKTTGPGRGGDVHITADSLTLENSSQIISQPSLGGLVGGDLVLNVGTLRLLGGSLIRSNPVTGVGGNVTVQGKTQGADSAADLVELSGGSGITSVAESSAGGGGHISIRANILDLDGASTTIRSSTSGTGRGGDIVLEVQKLSLEDGAAITSVTSSTGLNAGDGGLVTVQGLAGPESMASSVLLSGPSTGIVSNSQSGSPGKITVNTGTLTITNGASIAAGSSTSTGPAGNVNVTADSVVISADGRIFSRSFAQDSGKVTIKANELTLDKGSIVTLTESAGRGGDVVLDVGTVSLTNGALINSQSGSEEGAGRFSTGDAGNIKITSKSLTLANQSEITTSSLGILEDAGDAGTITITTTGNAVSLASGSSIASSTIGAGNAGQVIVITPTLNMDNATITTSTSGTGNAGSITANVGTMNLTNGGTVSSNSTGTLSGAGDAGSVTIKASGSFTSNGSKVSTLAENAKGGDILIDAQSVLLSNGTLISANSNAPLLLDGAGDAGNITIKSASNVVMQNSSVTTEASHASGGNIEIDAPDMVHLINSQLSTSVGGLAGQSDGGNITIDPQFVILQNSQILAQAVAGAGGAIDIIATSAFIADPDSIVSASSTLGISGTVNIQSPLQNVGGELAALSEEFSSAAALLAQQCAARAADGKFSTFVVAAREGLPVAPGGSLASPSLMAPLLVGSRLSGRDSHTQLSAVTGLFPKYAARPIQLAKFGGACYQ